jgi:hypothetical protein
MRGYRKLLPHQSIWGIVRVQWMEDFQPHYLVSLHQRGKLLKHLTEISINANKKFMKFPLEYLSRDWFDSVLREYVAPCDHLPDDDRYKISESLMAEILYALDLTPRLVTEIKEDCKKMYKGLIHEIKGRKYNKWNRFY